MTPKTPLARLQMLLPDVLDPKPRTGEIYLKFRLASALTVAISLDSIVETLQVPAVNLTPIPNMPRATLGLMSSQAKVFWALDLAALLEIPQAKQRPRQYEVIVVQALPMDNSAVPGGNGDAKGLCLGLSVQKIQSTLRLNPEQVMPEPQPAFPQLAPYVTGKIMRDGEEILLLNVESILSMRKLYEGK